MVAIADIKIQNQKSKIRNGFDSEPVSMTSYVGGTTVYYYYYDGLGSVMALATSDGTIAERYSYDVFGTPNTTSSVGNPFMFTGRQYEAQVHMYYYRARFYSPTLGRFMQPDPVMPYMQIAAAGKFTGEQIPGKYLSPTALQNYLQTDPVGRFLANDPAGRFLLRIQYGIPSELNLYTYGWNNPTNWLDPWGLCKDPSSNLKPNGIAGTLGISGLALAFVGGLAICSGLAPAVVAGGLIAVGLGGALAAIGGLLKCFGW
jgi:RHS repeat-associated protein